MTKARTVVIGTFVVTLSEVVLAVLALLEEVLVVSFDSGLSPEGGTAKIVNLN